MADWKKYVRHHLDYVIKPGISADLSLVVIQGEDYFTVELTKNGENKTIWFSKYAAAREYYENKLNEA